MTDLISTTTQLKFSNLTFHGKQCRHGRKALRNFLDLRFSKDELKIICFDLGVDWEEFGEHKSIIIIGLLRYLLRRNDLKLLKEWMVAEGILDD